MFAHLPIVGYSELEDCVVENSVATRWKPLRSIGTALLVRERLDELQMDVVVWCPYENHKDVRPFAQKFFFPLASSDVGLVWNLIIQRGCWGSLAMSRRFHANHFPILCISFVIECGQSDNNILFLLPMLCHLGVLRLAPMTKCLGFIGFSIPMSFRQRRDNH